MKLAIILIIILNYLVIDNLCNWCIERKPILKTRHRVNYWFPQRETFYNLHHKGFSPVETYYDFELQRVCCFGYRQIGETCVPNCVPDCPMNSTCLAPNRCHCNDGYYGHDDIAFLINCQPYCKEPCPLHAKCIAPNVCHCVAGYHLFNQSTCEPVCTKNCGPHAYCEAPDTCACHNNYKLIDNECQPICEKDCPTNAKCFEPNKCRCNENYQMKMTSLYEHYCEPICEPSCINGICTAPNSCKCYNNYQMISNGSICEPICKDGCINGKCIAPDMCECEDGYLMGPDNTCLPVCKEPCQMGQCIQPNLCKCLDGYTLKENSSSICQPICEPMCENGICMAPNMCICHENFMYADDNNITHICVPKLTYSSTTTEIIETETDEINATEIYATKMATIDMAKNFSSMGYNQAVTMMYSRTTEMHRDYWTAVDDTTENYFINDKEETENTTIDDTCLEYCQCWQKSGNAKPLPQTKCVHFCIDPYDQPCLNVTLCKCNNKELHCPNAEINKNNVKYTDNAEVNDSSVSLIYDCKMWRNFTTPHEKIIKSHQSISNDVNKWLWLIGIIAIAVIITISLFIYWYTHKTNSNYRVQYDQGA